MRLAVIISGRGSNLKAILDAAKEDDYPAEVVLIVADRPTAKGIVYGLQDDTPIEIVPYKDYDDPNMFEARLTELFEEHKIDLIVFAGFMRIVHKDFVDRWRNQIINIHPSLLPSFKGLHTHERALNQGVRVHGCTVHFVTADLDQGPIIDQKSVRIYDNDTPEKLGARVLKQEHKLLPACIKKIVTKHVRVVGHRVIFE